MSPLSIKERVFRVISHQLGVGEDSITRESLIVEDLGADSLAVIGLTMELEEEFSEKEFDFGIPDDDADKLKTVGQIVDYITNKILEKYEDACDNFT